MTFSTEFEFELPMGYVDPRKDQQGMIHKKGIMRLATAADEILPEKDIRVQSNPSYASVIILSRVITKLGKLSSEEINPDVIEALFLPDFKFLVSFYEKINEDGHLRTNLICPKCEYKFEVNFANQK